MGDRFRVPNDQGGHSLTAAGWREMARMQAELSALTNQIADLIEIQGQSSAAFRAAHVRWTKQQQMMLAFVGGGELFDVLTVPRKGSN